MVVPVQRTEELRLALVMNGGVSLAIWMGGVSFEINRFVGETHPVYRQLLELTRSQARIDVISGTSAGGINGAALALSSVYDTSLAPMREIWLDRANFAQLLRDSGEDDPPSVLDGDGYFLPMLVETFEKLTRPVARTLDVAPMDLTLTTTLLRGELSQRLDALGEVVEDATHRAQFRFIRGPQASQNTFDAKDSEGKEGKEDARALVHRLAHASRSTASFPVAFEPVLTQAGELRVNGNKKVEQAHFVMDGGVLDNKPIEAALRAIHNMPAQGNVRRVLAYVVPDPGVSAARTPDKAEEAPLIAQVALSSMTIPGVESIADQLEEIDARNKAVRRNRNLPVTLTSTVDPARLSTLAFGDLFNAYRTHRISGLLDYVLEEIEHFAAEHRPAIVPGFTDGATSPDAGRPTFGATTRQWLRATWLGMPDDERDALWHTVIPTGRTALQFAQVDRPIFAWGLYSVEYLHSVLMDLLRRILRLRHLRYRGEVTEGPVSVSPAPASAADWETEDQALRGRRVASEPERIATSHPGADEAISALCQRAFQLAAELRAERALRSRQFYDNASELLDSLNLATAEGPENQERAAIAWLREQFRIRAPSYEEAARGRHYQWAMEIVSILLAAKPYVDQLTGLDGARGLRPEEEADRAALKALASYLYRDSDGLTTHLDYLPWTPETRLLLHLLSLEICQYAFASRPAEIDSVVELVQISARQRSPLGGPADPEKKLAGMQLAHFGAFYRKSWRANDWMMGRLDGIARIVRIALNPDRLHRLYAGSTVAVDGTQLPPARYVAEVLHKICTGNANPGHASYLEREWQLAEPRIRQELEFLDSPRARVPESLPASAELLVRRLQLEVLCKELPQLAAAVAEDLDSGAESTQGRKLLGQLGLFAALQKRAAGWLSKTAKPVFPGAAAANFALTPDEALRLFNSYRVGAESIGDEVGTDLMLRTGSQTVYVAFNAATGQKSGLGPLSKLVNAFRWPMVIFYLLANRIQQGSRTDAALTASMLIAGALLAVAGIAWEKAPDAIGLTGWALLFAWFATASLRRVMAFLIGLVVVAAVFALTLLLLPDEAREHALGQMAGPAVVLAILVVTLFLPRWCTSLLLILGATWWFSGTPSWAQVKGAACGMWGVNGCLAPAEGEPGTHFMNALVVLLLLGVLWLLARLARTNRYR